MKDYRESHLQKGSDYDQFFNCAYLKFISNWESKILLKEINSDLILDFATGTGRILMMLPESTVGVDISQKMLGVARAKKKHFQLVCGDLTKQNPFKCNFDIITAFRFFMGAQDKLKIEALKSLPLKAGGKLIFNIRSVSTCPAVWLNKIVLATKNLVKSSNLRQQSLSIGHMIKLLSKTGYGVTKMYHRGVLPILDDKSNFPIQRFEFLENLFSRIGFLRYFSRYVIIVCEKT